MNPAMLLLSAALALGCDSKGSDSSTTDQAGETDDSKATDTSADTDDSKATDTSDDSEPTDTSADTDSEPTDTSADTDSEATDTSPDTDEPLPAGCSETDPNTNAQFKLLIDGKFAEHALDLACIVDAIETVEANSVTKLTCDDEGAPLAVEIHLPVAPEGDVSWAAGESVKLKSRYEDMQVTSEEHLELRRADDSLLIAALAAGGFAPDLFAPLTVEYIPACGPWDVDGSTASYQLDLELEGQPPLSLFSGNRGQLPIDAGESFAVDVKSAKYNECCHSSESFWILVRRVKAG